MKILITGAHFTPAVATIEQLEKFKETEIVYVGRKTTLEGDRALSAESQLFPARGIKFIPIITGRLQRNFNIYTIPSLLKVPIGFMQALYIVLSQKPDVILSFGGYVAVPVVIVGWLFSVPIIIHEQTPIPGLANRISSVFADKIAVSFDNNFFKDKEVILTGNPIRQELKGANVAHPKGEQLRILIIGGNQGSHAINLAVEQVLDKLLEIADVCHQTGDSRYKDYERLKAKESPSYKVHKFISKGWVDTLAGADLVITRAGINSLTELAYLGKPALIIPIPTKEQKINAEYFAGMGLGRVLPQTRLSKENLLKDIKLMINNLESLKDKAKEARKIIIPDAAKRLALEVALMKSS